MVALTLVHRHGYFQQQLDADGNQTETPDPWQPETELERVDAAAFIILNGREVHIRAWRYDVRGMTGSIIPVYLLDTDLPSNAEADRRITDSLYGGDKSTDSARRPSWAWAASPSYARLATTASAPTT